jgi:hypothetical protein
MQQGSAVVYIQISCQQHSFPALKMKHESHPVLQITVSTCGKTQVSAVDLFILVKKTLHIIRTNLRVTYMSRLTKGYSFVGTLQSK